ncbi:ABC transporter substrate-binding protein [Rathayibacter sp. PhB186]|nr:extracellular solute-binding protein [Rathayibacter sp. PhB186]
MTAGLAAGLAIALTACSGGSTAGQDEATPLPTEYTGDPVTLEMWGSTPNLKNAVDLFNESQSTITVNFTEQAGAGTLATNLRNAFAAGGGPDIFDTQTEGINSLASDGIALELTDLIGGEESKYSPVAWDAVTTDGRVFAVPASSIPQFSIYNAKVFADAGITEYPETWDDFIADGLVLKERGSKITNLAGEDYTNYVYMAWQAGAQWWHLDGDSWTVDVDSPETAKGADILQQMIDDDIVSKVSFAEYAALMQDFNDGKIASRQLSTWQTKGMQANLTTGLGQWEPAPYPSYSGEDAANVSFTRAFAVNSKTKNADAAAFAANWLATDDASVAKLADPIDGTSWFPAVADPAPYISISEPTQLIGEYAPEWEPTVTDAVQAQKGDWTYGPNASAAFTVLADLWGKALDGQMKVADIAPQLQEWIVDDLTSSGIDVTE